jgi:hypothetical protein
MNEETSNQPPRLTDKTDGVQRNQCHPEGPHIVQRCDGRFPELDYRLGSDDHRRFYPAVMVGRYALLETLLVEQGVGNDEVLDLVEEAAFDGCDAIAIPRVDATDLVIVLESDGGATMFDAYIDLCFDTPERAMRCAKRLQAYLKVDGECAVFACTQPPALPMSQTKRSPPDDLHIVQRCDVRSPGIDRRSGSDDQRRFYPGFWVGHFFSVEAALLESFVDNGDLVDVLEDVLDLTLETASDGCDAIAIPRLHRIDLVLVPEPGGSATLFEACLDMRFDTPERAMRCAKRLQAYLKVGGQCEVFMFTQSTRSSTQVTPVSAPRSAGEVGEPSACSSPNSTPALQRRRED